MYGAWETGKRLERVTGIELAYPTWKDGALAIELHPHAGQAR
jgi:hypothetical protein